MIGPKSHDLVSESVFEDKRNAKLNVSQNEMFENMKNVPAHLGKSASDSTGSETSTEICGKPKSMYFYSKVDQAKINSKIDQNQSAIDSVKISSCNNYSIIAK